MTAHAPRPIDAGAEPAWRDPFLLAALAAGALVWTLGALGRSLWVDEFHTLHHLRAPDLASFFASVRSDNHPPLGFLIERASRALLGESQLALRLPSILTGLAFVVAVHRIARRLPDRASRRAAPFLAVLSTFCFTAFTEIRMYGLLALAVAGLLASVLAVLEGARAARWACALWIAAALHTHYYSFHYLFVLALCVAVLAALAPELRPRAARLVVPALVGALAFVPWAVWGFAEQLRHGLGSGGQAGLYLNLSGWCQSIGHLLFLNASLGGRAATWGLAFPGTLAAAALGALGLWRLATARRKRTFLVLLLGLGLGVPAWSFLVAVVFPRASYGWRYIAGSVAPVLCLVAAGMGRWRPWPRAALGGLLLATLLGVTLVNVASPGDEDFRGAVRHVLADARPGDALVTFRTWSVAPEGTPTVYGYYRERLGPPRAGAEPVEYTIFDGWRPALRHERVWVIMRSRFPNEVHAELGRSFERSRTWSYSPVVTLYLFEGPRAAGEGGLDR